MPLLAILLLLALTAEELVARNLAARGGLDKLRAITSLRLTGTVKSGGQDLAYVSVAERPGRLRTEVTIQGLTAISAWDGTAGWRISPFGGRKDPERLPADVARSLEWGADFEGPLAGYQEKGHQLEYLGTEDVDGTDAHKLRLTRKSGDVELIYLDPDYFLEIRVKRTRKIRGVESESTTDYGNYEKVAGVYFPFSIDSPGSSVVIEKAEVNVAAPASLFLWPGSK